MLKTGLILAFLFSIQLLISCTQADKHGNNDAPNPDIKDSTANIIKDNVEEFGTLVRLPYEPEEVTWKETAANPPNSEGAASHNSKKLTAVLRFSKENAKKIIAQAEKIQSSEAASLGTEPWFPAELIAQSQLNGDDILKGASYSAADFYLPPYTDGRVTRIENTDFFVLKLVSR